jgi:hypothetical protein
MTKVRCGLGLACFGFGKHTIHRHGAELAPSTGENVPGWTASELQFDPFVAGVPSQLFMEAWEGGATRHFC